MYEQRIIKLQIGGSCCPDRKILQFTTRRNSISKQNERKSIALRLWTGRQPRWFRFFTAFNGDNRAFRVHKATRNYYQLNGQHLMWASHASRGPWPMEWYGPGKWATSNDGWMSICDLSEWLKYVRLARSPLQMDCAYHFVWHFYFRRHVNKRQSRTCTYRQFHELFRSQTTHNWCPSNEMVPFTSARRSCLDVSYQNRSNHFVRLINAYPGTQKKGLLVNPFFSPSLFVFIVVFSLRKFIVQYSFEWSVATPETLCTFWKSNLCHFG